MDGYHYPLSYLHSLPNPSHALARRGAPFTFDSPSYLTLVKSLRPALTPSTLTIHAPSFSHTTKDPVADAIPIPASSRILIFEGNYLSLDEGDWKEAAGLMDEHWFVEVEEETAGRRLVKRHVKSGVAEDEESAWRRARENDLPNGRDVVEGRRKGIDEFVVSKEDESWRAVGEE
ncbi:hypothetical protein ACEPPN_008936 [Leptodophora sp. 'Broadleaf-Isolate-01']